MKATVSCVPVGLLLGAAAHQGSIAAEAAGSVIEVAGEVYGQLSGEQQRKLAQGAKVYVGDNTGPPQIPASN